MRESVACSVEAISTAPEPASDAATEQMLARADTAALTGFIDASSCRLRAATCSGCLTVSL